MYYITINNFFNNKILYNYGICTLENKNFIILNLKSKYSNFLINKDIIQIYKIKQLLKSQDIKKNIKEFSILKNELQLLQNMYSNYIEKVYYIKIKLIILD